MNLRLLDRIVTAGQPVPPYTMPISVPTPAGKLRLHSVRDADADFLIRLYASTRSEEAALFGMNEAQWSGFLQVQFQLQQTQFLQNFPAASRKLIRLQGDPVGRVYVDRSPGCTHLIEISLLPEFRRKGIGSALLRSLQQESATQGGCIVLRVQKSNPALAFYRQLGFEVSHDEVVFWRMCWPPA